MSPRRPSVKIVGRCRVARLDDSHPVSRLRVLNGDILMTFPADNHNSNNALPARYARGWHCLGIADDFRDGKLHTLNVFGSRLLAFADDTGKISVLDAHCPHMGADLSQGTLEGNRVVCPFHHWKFEGSGRCV